MGTSQICTTCSFSANGGTQTLTQARGTPTGTTSKIGNIEVYIAEPKGDNVHKNTAILYLPDVIGICMSRCSSLSCVVFVYCVQPAKLCNPGQNSKLMADQYAANGYYTVILDLFNGDPWSLNPPSDADIFSWIKGGSSGDNGHTTKEVDPIVEAGIKFLQSKGFTKIGAVGYCFGAKYVVRYQAKGKGIDVGYVAHPSFVDEDELRALVGPFSIAAAETDAIFPEDKRKKSEEILEERKKTTGEPYELVGPYQGTEHGFAVRADINNKVIKKAKEDAFVQAVAWFDKHLL